MSINLDKFVNDIRQPAAGQETTLSRRMSKCEKLLRISKVETTSMRQEVRVLQEQVKILLSAQPKKRAKKSP